jgi:hypothetical protein
MAADTGSRPPAKRRRYYPSPQELKYGFRAYVTSHVFRIAALTIRCAVPIVVVWIACEAWVRCTALLAGKTTSATINEKFSFITNFVEPFARNSSAADWILPIPIAVALWALWAIRRMRRRYQDNIEQLASFRERFERLQDPRRSSSRLTPRGDPPPEEEL